MDVSPVMEFLRSSVDLFSDFPESPLRTLVERSRITTFEPSEAIIRFGQEGRFLGILMGGEALASVTDDNGDVRVLGSMHPGDVFGEMSLMTGDKTTADVIGTTRCKVLQIPPDVVMNVLVTHSPALKKLSRTISDRLRRSARSEADRDLTASAFKKSEDPYGFRLETDEPARVLVINCGSSSLKYTVFDTANNAGDVRGTIERIGTEGTVNTLRSAAGEFRFDLPPGDHATAFAHMVKVLTDPGIGGLRSAEDITIIGHRVVHGGEKFSSPVLVTQAVVDELESLISLAPLHNPVNLAGIRAAMRFFPGVPHVAVFDTSFHHTMPPYAYLYGLPYDCYETEKIRRYGFHGMSHAFVSLKAAEYLKRPYNELEVVSCHLGNGASICAVDHGRSIDTSMGLTPTEGLIMGSRCGDLDPAVLLRLMESRRMGAEELTDYVNRESGLKGISGISHDMREIERAAEAGEHRALLAFKTFCYRVRKYIGAYVAAMGGLDVLIFTGGIGQGSAGVRSLACQKLDYMGIQISEERNRNARGFEAVCDISTDDARVRVLVVPTDEERMIARESLRTMVRNRITRSIHGRERPPVPIEVSAHHVHLSQEHVEALFGPGHQLTPESPLSQPGQFACHEKVHLIGPKGRVERVRVLGPTRPETQIEISMTEQFILGIQPPIRQSGDLENSPGITIEGTLGTVGVEKGVICALRHIHMAPEDALAFGLRDKSVVRVQVEGDRELVFGGVLIRVHPSFKLAMHIDTDEANAARINTGLKGIIDEVQHKG